MTQRVILAENPLDSATWTDHDVDDIRRFLASRYAVWPQTGRIYHQYVAENCDVTPADEAGIARLARLPGPFFVVVYPENPTIVIAVIAVVAAVAAAFLFRPKIPNIAARNNNPPSSNNSLSDRQNSERIGGRIPDIFGTVRSVPDLLAPPYTVYESGEEVEHCLMCVGRGTHQISDVRDGDTLVSQIAGTSVEFYAPNTSPLTGTPFLNYGDRIGDSILAVKRCTGVNGQTMPARVKYWKTNGASFFHPNKIHVIDDAGGDKGDMTKLFNVGDPVYFDTEPFGGGIDLGGYYTIESTGVDFVTLVNPGAVNAAWNGAWADGSGNVDLGLVCQNYTWIGPFTVGTRESTYLLCNFVALNGLYKDDGNNQMTTNVTLEVQVTPLNASDAPLGPAVSRSYTLVGSATKRSSIGGTLRIPIAPQGATAYSSAAYYYAGDFVWYAGKAWRCSGGLLGGAVHNYAPGNWLDVFGIWREAIPPGGAKYSVRARRSSDQSLYFTGQVMDEVKWRDLYAASDAMTKMNGLGQLERVNHFGDLTLVRTKTKATEGALAVKERKLNCLATRCLPCFIPVDTPIWAAGTMYDPGFVFYTPLSRFYYSSTRRYAGELAPGVNPNWIDVGLLPGAGNYATPLLPTNRVDHILDFLCKDPRIGGRSSSELDLANFRDTVAAVKSYFGTYKSIEFGYTFDQTNMSFEETVSSVAATIFCHAYRRGSQIKLSFEKATNDSTLLFNHRNKIPGSEVRTVRFGKNEEADGIEFQYVDPSDDSLVTFYVPEDQSALNPKRIESLGIRSKLQARFHAYRLYNRLRYQNVTTEFEATQESALLLLGDRILVADGTRTGVWDGDVLEQNVLELTLSQNQDISSGGPWVIFLQHTDGLVESIGVTQGSAPNKVVLAQAPRAPLVIPDVDNDLDIRTLYWITKAASTRETAFLVDEREPKSLYTSTVRAVNYDPRYYANDLDFAHGVVNEDGN